MQTRVVYDESFSHEEKECLEVLLSVIESEWIVRSGSTSSLKWHLEVEDQEPRRFAVLKTSSGSTELHKESFYSLTNKLIENRIEAFKNEFVDRSQSYQQA